LTAEQRQTLDADLRDATVGHVTISRMLTTWGYEVSETSVRRYRDTLGVALEREDPEPDEWQQASVIVTSEGGTFSTGALDRPLDLSTDWNEVLVGFGLDPEIFAVEGDSVAMSKWQQSRRLDNGDRDIVWLYSYRARFTRKRPDIEPEDIEDLRKRVQAWRPRAVTPSDPELPGSTFVVCWADWQMAKSAGGGVTATVERVLESYNLVVKRIEELRTAGRNIERIVVVNMGDPCEGCDGNYSSQLFSIELNQREQLNLVLDLWMAGVTSIQPDDFISVLCNHGEWTRRGPGTRPVTTDSDNIGGYLADTLRRVFEGRDGAPVRWHIPHDEMITMVDLSGVNVAFTHGHKIPSPAKEQDWLKSQSIRLLREQGSEPRLWVTAHRHHVNVTDFGPWWRLQCPSLDGGSKWYTDSSGNWATPGTMTFLVGQHDSRRWSDLAILGSGV
jgi:hypothetical protein